ncbi:S23A2-like protein, partial [Mya arenaria]
TNGELQGNHSPPTVMENAEGLSKGTLLNGHEPHVDIDITDEPLFHYDVFENPPVPLTIGFALQQMLMSLSRSLSTSLLVADILCARADEALKARLLSTTMFMSGVCTLLQNTIGIRLPLYQGPTASYVVPLLALMSLPAWACNDDGTIPVNSTTTVDDKIQKLEGSLMIAGVLHVLVGLTGIVGLLLRFIGPITVVPALTIMALYVFSATVRFAKAQWGITVLTVAIALILSFYLKKFRTPLPFWTPARGFHIRWSHFHKMFSVISFFKQLSQCMCIYLSNGEKYYTPRRSQGVFQEGGEDSRDYYARTDTRTYIIYETNWFIFPYPGQFGPPGYDTGALITFILGTIGSIIDSIGDYYACVKVIEAPPPPKHAVNRGIAVEGFMSILAGWAGAAHATSTFGGNIGAIGITRVGAVFITIPYSVIGGLQIINFGVLAGVMLSNLQFIDLGSKRNVTIIGMSMLVAMMMPHWVKTTENPINTDFKRRTTKPYSISLQKEINIESIEELNNTILMLLANPVFMAGFLACFLDNTMPGTLKERGIKAWQTELETGVDDETIMENKPTSVADADRRSKLIKILY